MSRKKGSTDHSRRQVTSEEHFRSLLQNHPLPAFIIDISGKDPTGYTFLAANEAAASLYGYSEKEFRGMKLTRLRPAEDLERFRRELDKTGPEAPVFRTSAPHRHLKRDGSIIYVDVHANRIEYEGLSARLVMVSDVTEKVLAEQQLAESEERHRLLTERSHIGIALLQDGRLVFSNSRLGQIFDSSPEDLTGIDFMEFIHPDDRDLLTENIRLRMEGGGPESYIIRAIDRSGNDKLLEIIGSRISWDGRPAILGAVLDVTSREEVQNRLKLFSAAIEEAAEGVQLVDLDGKIIYSNRAVEKIYGFTPDEFLGRHVNELNVDPEFAGKHILPAIMESGHWAGELEVRHKDGHQFPVALATSMVFGDENKPLAMVGVIRDITEQRLYQEKLEVREAQYRAMFESQSDAVMIFSRDCQIADVNPAACEMYGYTREEMLDKNCRDLITPAYQHLFEEAQQVVARGQQFHGESVEIRKSGIPFPTDVRIAPFLYDGEPHALVVARDMTFIKDTQQALKRSEEVLSAIFDNVRAGIMVIDPKEHEVVNINTKAAEMIGLPKGDVVGRKCHEFVCPREEGKCPITDLNEEVNSSERELVRADGSRIPILKTVVSVDLLGKPMLVESFVDISDLKAVEGELRARDDAIRSSISGFALADLDGRLTYVNPSFVEMWGYEREDEIMGRSVLEFWTSSEEAARILRALEKAGRWSGEMTALRKDGSTFPVQLAANMTLDDNGQPQMMIGSFIDVTRRKRFEEALRQSEQLFRTIFQTSPDAVSINRMTDGVYMEINDGFAALTGYTPDDVVGETPVSLGVWIDPARLKDLGRFLSEKGRVSNFEASFRLKDGRVRAGLLSAHVITMDGKPHVVSVTRDIEDLKQAENYLKQTLADLEEKNRELESFVYTAAHDLRTPIISVLGFVDLLKRELADGLEKEQSYMLGRIGANVQHFDNLLRDLLDYSQTGIAEGKRDSVDVKVLVEQILAEERAHKMDPRPSVSIQDDLPRVEMQSTRAYQVLRNLVSNSLKFGKEDRPLEIEVGRATGFDGRVPHGHAMFFVRDNGIGIEKKYQDAIFGLFTRPRKSTTEGTGVGLAIVKRIVEGEGGVIHLDSARGRGATFYFSLPVAKS